MFPHRQLAIVALGSLASPPLAAQEKALPVSFASLDFYGNNAFVFLDSAGTFNPIYLTDGIQLSDDPLIPLRSAVYALSVQHRR